MPEMSIEVRRRFDDYPQSVRPVMLRLRDLIYEVARATEGVGDLTETLKWGEPAYLTEKSKSGTTI